MLLIITGNGKGKTTSALGTAMRSAGWENKTAILFMDKGGGHYGEHSMLETMSPHLEVHRFGLPRFDEVAKTFRFENTPEDEQEAERAVEKALELMAQNYFLIVCDELINCLNLGLLKQESVERLVNAKPKETHLILTGRNVPDWLAEKSDLISEVKEVKHYFKQGQQAIKGIDF